MKEFDELVRITEQLIGPDGCPWDRVQTFESIRSHIIEEVHELVDAAAKQDMEELVEEIGDVMFIALFYCKIAEKESKFTTEQVLDKIASKLISRHQHVFGDAEKFESADAVLAQWEQIKQKEPDKKNRKSKLDGIPRDLPALARCQKVVKKFDKAGFDLLASDLSSEEEKIGKKLFDIVNEARELGVEAEVALRSVMSRQEEAFCKWEKDCCSH